jgi:flagellar M-ring protein FliF
MGELFNKVRSGFNEMWSGLDKGHKIRILVAGALSIILIASVVFFTSRIKFEPLYYDLSQATAGTVNEKLKEMGVKTKVEGTTVYVPEGKASELRVQLAADGVINDEGSIPETSTSSFYETSEDKKQRYLKSKENDISRGLRALKGVEWASVQLYIPDDLNILQETKTDSTAGIIIKMKTGAEPLDEKQVKGIANYVARSVKGLQPENIEIIDENGRALLSQKDTDNPVGTNLDRTSAVKKDIEQSISKFLQKVFGPSNVEVTAAVKLNFNSEVVDSTEFVAPDAEKNAGIVRNMQEIKKDWVDPGTGGVPGTDTNTDIKGYVETDTSKAQYSEASTVVNYEINEIKKKIVKEQGNVEALTIAVIINKRSLKEDVLANGDTLRQDVKDLVKYATQGFNTQALAVDDNISIKVMDFDTSIKDSVQNEIAQEAAQRRNQTFIMIGTALLAILVLGGTMFVLLRRRAAAEPEYEFESTAAYVAAAQSEEPQLQEIEFEDKNELKKKLEKFVGQKPEQVAQLLKTWLSED